jgi:hypothetical protein
MLEVAKRAVEHWGEAEKNPALLVELGFHNSVQWQQRGEFKLSDTHITDAIELHHASEQRDPFVSLTLYNHKSNVQACLNRHDEAYEWQLRIESLHKEPGAELVRPTTLTNRNMARCLAKIGRTNDALEKYGSVMNQSKGASANWANLAQ